MSNSFPRRQEGAALIVGLVLLMILTVLGVTGLTTATTEVAMADNMQRAQYAFHAAESAAHAEMKLAPATVTLNGLETRGTVLIANTDYPYTDEGGNNIANAAVRTNFQGYIEFGDSSKQVHYESRAVATTPSRGAQSIQRVGYFVLAPN